MPSTSQRKEIGRAAYAAGSAIAVRSARLSLAKRIDPIREGDPFVKGITSSGRTTTAADYVAGGKLSGTQIDGGREPFLLFEDILNEGEFNTIPVHDSFLEREKRTGKCVLVLHRGEVLVPADTLIYWK
ncbi:hypothetical protein [Pseudomonas serbica]|uniref:hypothetical protein n=1 Tax=Pseudomonas serbica TaxID=2965074 RepID=UPI00237ADBC5|nr:hypothetical protein [Pseudomonas serbica]